MHFSGGVLSSYYFVNFKLHAGFVNQMYNVCTISVALQMTESAINNSTYAPASRSTKSTIANWLRNNIQVTELIRTSARFPWNVHRAMPVQCTVQCCAGTHRNQMDDLDNKSE